MEVLKELKNDLLKRNEVEVVITQDKNPTTEEAIQAIAKQFKASEDTIKIKGINGKFGSHEFTIGANIYNTKEDKDTIEVKTKQEKEAEAKAKEEASKEAAAPEEAAKPAEEAPTPAEPAAKEKPAEKVKEEAPAEKPKEEESKA